MERTLTHWLHTLRRLTRLESARDVSDHELMDRFRQHGDEAAFAALLHRHGPLVLGVCRRMLRDTHAVEDAFQATFLVLLRKADTLRRRDLLAGWLHGVAQRVALKARVQATKLHSRESPLIEEPACPPGTEAVWAELRLLLDEEIQRLPERYRRPVVLCYLEGKTYEEAAALLGSPKGTVAIRLSRAREQLRRRLTRRGVDLSASIIIGLLTATYLAADVPPALHQATLAFATPMHLTQLVASDATKTILHLAEGVAPVMSHSQRFVLPALIVILFAGVALTLSWAGTPPPQIPVSQPQADVPTLPLGRGSIVGQITGPDGKPLAGAKVHAVTVNIAHGLDRTSKQAISDAQGRFLLQDLPANVYCIYLAEVPQQPTWTAKAVEAVDVIAGKTAQTELQAKPGILVKGRVLQANTRQPLANVYVSCRNPARPETSAASFHVRTDEKGEFQWYVPPGTSHIEAMDQEAFGFSENRKRTILVQENRPVEEIILYAHGPATPVKGENSWAYGLPFKPPPPSNAYRLFCSYRTKEGKPVAVRFLWFFKVKEGRSYPLWVNEGLTGIDMASLKNDAGMKITMVIEADGYARPPEPEIILAEQMPPLTVTLEPATFVSMRGRVVDTDGKPIAGARVDTELWIKGSFTQGPWGPQPLTDQDGRFELRHIRRGDKVGVKVSKAGWSGAWTGPLTITKAADLELPALRMGPAKGEIRGVVQNWAGKPVANASVFDTDANLLATTDAQGRFTVRNLPYALVRLQIMADGYIHDRPQVYPNGKEQTFTLQETKATAYARAFNLKTDDGKPVRRVQVSIWCKDDPSFRPRSSQTADATSVTCCGPDDYGLRPGKTFVVAIEAEGYAQPAVIEYVPQPRMPAVDVPLKRMPSLTLRGRVVDAAGKPLAGIEVGTTVPRRDGTPPLVREYPWVLKLQGYNEQRNGVVDKYYGVKTDAQGRYELKDITQGSRFRVTAALPGHDRAQSELIEAKAGQELTAPDLRIVKTVATGTVSGRLLDPWGRPLVGAEVSNRERTTTTDAQGRFTLDGLPRTFYGEPTDIVGLSVVAWPLWQWHTTVKLDAKDVTLHFGSK